MVVPLRPFALLALLAPAIGCKPDFDERPSTVSGLRVLSIRSTPAEVRPGDSVSLHADVIDPSGDRTDVALQWALCSLRKPLAEAGPIDPACLALQAPFLQAVGSGVDTTVAVPKDACRQIGPDAPEVKAGEPQARPVDPDPTGGYYMPVRLAVSDGVSWGFDVGQTRVRCGLPNATQEQSVSYEKGYHANANPAIDSVQLTWATGSATAGAEPVEVPAGTRIELTVQWMSCARDQQCGDGQCVAGEDASGCPQDCSPELGCSGAESYLWYDPASRAVQTRSESIRVSWYATGGSFDNDRTGREEGDFAVQSTNIWTSPAQASSAVVWIVLRDSRGGAGLRRVDVSVRAPG